MSQKALTALAFLIGGLLAIVIIISLAQKTLDGTGVAVALTSALVGIVGGSVIKRGGDSKEDPP